MPELFANVCHCQAAWDVCVIFYYLIAVHALPFIYNYVAMIVTELLTMSFYAATFSALAALYTNHRYSDLLYDNVILAIIAMSAFALYVCP